MIALQFKMEYVRVMVAPEQQPLPRPATPSSTTAPSATKILFQTNTGTGAATVNFPTIAQPSVAICECSTRVVQVNHEPFTSAVTGSTSSSSSSSESKSHVVTIQISDSKENIIHQHNRPLFHPNKIEIKEKVTVVSLQANHNSAGPVEQQYPLTSSISNNQYSTEEMVVQNNTTDLEVNGKQPKYLYYMMPSGQCSPSDTMDSGTCSDLENTPPPLPKKMSSKSAKGISTIAANKTNAGNHHRCVSFTDSEESESSLSCDSLNSTDLNGIVVVTNQQQPKAQLIPAPPPMMPTLFTAVPAMGEIPKPKVISSPLPDSLLRDIRDRSSKLCPSEFIENARQSAVRNSEVMMYNKKNVVFNSKVQLKNYVSSPSTSPASSLSPAASPTPSMSPVLNKTSKAIDIFDAQHKEYERLKNYENDKFYKFHINERDVDDEINANGFDSDFPAVCKDDESFAGYKELNGGTSTIRSSKGTVRGVKNRVRNGITTFLQMQQTNVKVRHLFFLYIFI